MINFKRYSAYRRTKEGHIILDEPIHFKNSLDTYNRTKEGHIILDVPIQFKNNKLKEDTASADDTHNANIHNIKQHISHEHLSDKLHSATASNLNSEEKRHIAKFTGHHDDENKTGSYYLNKRLVRGEKPTGHLKDMHDTIKKHAKPSGHDFHLFSGTSRDLGEIARHSKDHIIHAPAHTSATHDLRIARQFATDKFFEKSRHEPENKISHLMHIHVKPHDKVFHTSKLSHYENEHETVVPSGTKLKYSHSSDHTWNDSHYKVHHFTIHSQD